VINISPKMKQEKRASLTIYIAYELRPHWVDFTSCPHDNSLKIVQY
jgi:hypothetical protein